MPERRPGERQSIAECLRDISIARDDLRRARHQAIPGWNTSVLRAELLAALEGYAAAITQAGAPVPRTLRSEIELYRRLRNRS